LAFDDGLSIVAALFAIVSRDLAAKMLPKFAASALEALAIHRFAETIP
jgi:hypothetical protein